MNFLVIKKIKKIKKKSILIGSLNPCNNLMFEKKGKDEAISIIIIKDTTINNIKDSIFFILIINYNVVIY